MRFASLVAVLGITTLSLASLVACGGEASEGEEDEFGSEEGAVKSGSKVVVIDADAADKTIPIKLGESFSIDLSENRSSSGYSWTVMSVDKDLGQPTDISLDAVQRGRVGGSSTKHFVWETPLSKSSLVGPHVIVLQKARGLTKPIELFKVTVDIQGSGPVACGGKQGTKCGTGSFCDYTAKAKCGANETGTCKPILKTCTTVVKTVCGCDGKTYANECEANSDGVSVLASGACKKTKK